MSKPAFILDANRMFRAMKIANTEPSHHRVVIKGTRIEPMDGGGVLMIATNGEIMLIQRDRQGHANHAATLVVTAPKVEPILNDDGTFVGEDYYWCGAEITVAALEPNETVAALASRKRGSPGPYVLVERLEDKFPDWRNAIEKPALRADDGSELVPRQDAKGGFTTKSVNPLIANRDAFRLHGNLDDGSQMLLTYDNDPDSLGVLMKCKIPGKQCQPEAMLTAIGRSDLVAAKTAH